MNPYKIMLVDDEEEVRTSIIRKIDWQDAGFEVIGDAENGKEAQHAIPRENLRRTQNPHSYYLADLWNAHMEARKEIVGE